MRHPILLLLLLAACSTTPATSAPSESAPPTTSAAVTTTSEDTPTQTTVPDNEVESTTTTVDEEAVATADLAIFIAALEAGLSDTKYEGTALSDPSVYIATGQLFCEELDAGANPALLLSDYLEILTEGDIGAAEDDDLVVAGLLLGVSVEVMCPQHSDALTDAGF